MIPYRGGPLPAGCPDSWQEQIEWAQANIAPFEDDDGDDGAEPKFRLLDGTGAHDPSEPLGYDAEGWAAVMEGLGVEWRWNVRMQRVEIRESGDADWTAITDNAEADLRLKSAAVYKTKQNQVKKWNPAKTKWELMRNGALHYAEVDPFIEWLEALPPWDGTPRLDTLLECLFTVVGGGVDPRIVEWASRYLIVGGVQRSYQPGCELRQIPVLIGPQGGGKSRLGPALLPPGTDEDWFADELPLDARGKEKAETMAGRVIVEMSEMAGITRADLERLKAFLTRRNDGQHRGAYAHHPVASPRRCVMYGTTNEVLCLPQDDSGHSRFVPLTVGEGRGHIDTLIAGLGGIEQLWAEGLARYRDGLRANLPRELFDVQAEITKRHVYINSQALEALDSLFTTADEVMMGLPLASIRERCPGSQRVTDKQFAKALEYLGWVKRRVTRDGAKRNLWFPPAEHGDGGNAQEGERNTPVKGLGDPVELF
ncbi:MAG: hypothetical protein OXQ29_19415 [Rhodospirillaceae bacterium]|nr:hypothetical protein [Rhodospirillaceae bacterium]